MDKDKKLSAARKKLQEYKMNRGTATTHGTVSDESAISSSSTPPPPQPERFSPDYHNNQNWHGLPAEAVPSPLFSDTSPAPLTSTFTMTSENISCDVGNQNHTDTTKTEPELSHPLANNLHFNEQSSSSDFNSSHLRSSSVPQHLVEPTGNQHDAHPPPVFTSVPSAPPLATLANNFSNVQNSHIAPHNPFSRQRPTDACQDFPVNFFQPAPAAQEYQPVSFNQIPQQQFFYGQPSPPLFYNVDGNTIKPLQPYQVDGTSQNLLNVESSTDPHSTHSTISFGNNNSQAEAIQANSPEPTEHDTASSNALGITEHHRKADQDEVKNQDASISPSHLANENNESITPHLIEEQALEKEMPIFRTVTPNLRRPSVSSQDERDRLEMQAFQRMKSVQEALELQLEELRRDNERLLQRQSELVSQIEDNEKNVQELRRERDRSKDEAKKSVQPLHAKINNLYEENQRILKNSNDVGMELRAKLQEKSKLHEEMEQAFIVVSTSKMNIAAELDQERERRKELESIVSTKDDEMAELRSINSKLEERLKAEQQKEAVIHQLEDQRRHYMVQTETLQGDLVRANNKLRQLQPPSSVDVIQGELSNNNVNEHPKEIYETGEHSNHHEHTHDEGHTHEPHHGHDSHDHGHDHNQGHTHGNDHSHDHGHDHSHDHGHDHSHDHSHNHSHDHSHNHSHDHGHNHSHDHGHDHGHDHNHDHNHDHGHDHNHDHSHDHGHGHDHGNEVSIPRPPTNEFSELKKRLHHLEWENSTFRTDVEKLSVDAREKKQFEEKFNNLKGECEKLRNECNRLELLVVQLQGENDTIGDYITLYQSQRLALKESAKEKDVQMEKLGQEREMLLTKMAELTHLLKELKGPEADGLRNQLSQSVEHHHQCSNSKEHPQNAEIEGKIRNLLTEISSSSLIENFHPCAVCSGRLLNV